MLGLIAGGGMVPIIFCRSVIKRGGDVAVVDLNPEPSEELAKVAAEYKHLPIGAWQEIVQFFVGLPINEIYFLGKVEKRGLYLNSQLDEACLKVITSATNKGDQGLLQAFGEDLLCRGIKVGDPTVWLKPFLFGTGVLSKAYPTPKQNDDISYGFTVAKALADLDIGQTVVVKEQVVLALEAIEGTDKALARGGSLAPGAVAVKVARTYQDSRYDIPVIGPGTVEVMKTNGIKALAFEANKTYLIEPSITLELADSYNLVIVGREAEVRKS